MWFLLKYFGKIILRFQFGFIKISNHCQAGLLFKHLHLEFCLYLCIISSIFMLLTPYHDNIFWAMLICFFLYLKTQSDYLDLPHEFPALIRVCGVNPQAFKSTLQIKLQESCFHFDSCQDQQALGSASL